MKTLPQLPLMKDWGRCIYFGGNNFSQRWERKAETPPLLRRLHDTPSLFLERFEAHHHRVMAPFGVAWSPGARAPSPVSQMYTQSSIGRIHDENPGLATQPHTVLCITRDDGTARICTPCRVHFHLPDQIYRFPAIRHPSIRLCAQGEPYY